VVYPILCSICQEPGALTTYRCPDYPDGSSSDINNEGGRSVVPTKYKFQEGRTDTGQPNN
jgi:hypothetical protein